MRRYGFIDSSGILKSDQLFGVGLFLAQNVGDIGDKLYKNSQPAKERMVVAKNELIDTLLQKDRKDEVISILRKSRRFEMKSDNIGSRKILPYYEGMVDIFFSDPDNRFSTMIVNKQNPGFNNDGIEDSWETYTKYIALLVVHEMRLLPNDEFTLVVDEISKPQTKVLSLEDTIMSKIREETSKDPMLDFNRIFGAVTIESHSNMPMQLSDVLLGAVMFDYKEKFNLNSERTKKKKESFVQKIRGALNVLTLAEEFTRTTPAYFSVFECI